MSAFDKIIGYKEEKEELMRICDMIKNPAKYKSLGVKLPRGLLLHGQPGVGKTLMATALIEELGLRTFCCENDRSDIRLINDIVKVFNNAVANTPSVVFLDDIDKFLRGDSYQSKEMSTVQVCIDSAAKMDLFVIATANEIDMLPDSLKRPGRFDHIINVRLPDRKEAEEIVKYYLHNKKVASDVDAKSVARMLDGRSCAVLESVLDTAGVYAGYENRVEIEMKDIIRAILTNIFEAEEYLTETSPGMKEEVAYHEAGHVVAAMTFDPDSIGIVSVRSSKSEQKGVVQLYKSENYFGSYRSMRERALVLLAGRAAVELQYGNIDVGASVDINRANTIIERFVVSYATSGLDLIRIGRGVVSEFHDDKIVTERNRLLAQFYDEAKNILRANWSRVQKLAAALVERDTLVNDDIVAICGFGKDQAYSAVLH